jgi:hypothetical protein
MMMARSSSKNRRFGGRYRFLLYGERHFIKIRHKLLPSYISERRGLMGEFGKDGGLTLRQGAGRMVIGVSPFMKKLGKVHISSSE